MVQQAIDAVHAARNGGVAWTLCRHLKQAGVPLESSWAAKLGMTMLNVNEATNGEQAARHVLELVHSYSNKCLPLRSVGCSASAMLGDPDGVVDLIRDYTRPGDDVSDRMLTMPLLRAYGRAGRLDDAFATFEHLCSGRDVLQAPPVLAASRRRTDGHGGRDADVATGETSAAGSAGAAAGAPVADAAAGQTPKPAGEWRRTMLRWALVEACVAAGDPWRGLRLVTEWVGRHDPRIARPQLTTVVLAQLLKGFVAHARRDRRVLARVDEVLALAAQYDVPIGSAAISALGSAGGYLTPKGLRALGEARSSGARVSRAAELMLLEACLDACELDDAEWVAGAAPRELGHAISMVSALSRKLKHEARQCEIETRASRHLGTAEEEDGGWHEGGGGASDESLWPEEEQYWARLRDQGPGEWRAGPGDERGAFSAGGAQAAAGLRPPGRVEPGFGNEPRPRGVGPSHSSRR